MTQGSEYEFWEENTYNAYENVYRCLAYRDYGNFVRLVQGIGSDCNGISGELSMDNAFRTMDLQKVRRDLTQCDFPLWVRGKTWKVVARGGMRSLGTPQADNQPRQVSFTDSNSFILGTEVSKFCLFHIQIFKKYLQRRYKLGIYDCRHYVNKFTQWCLYKPTPIWDLHLLWEEY